MQGEEGEEGEGDEAVVVQREALCRVWNADLGRYAACSVGGAAALFARPFALLLFAFLAWLT